MRSPGRTGPVIARELAEIGARLADLAARVQALDGAKADGGERGNGEAGRLLSAKDVAARTGLSLARIYALGRQGQAGAVKVGERAVRFSEAALDTWVRSGGVS